MISIEQRIADALLDVEAMLNEGGVVCEVLSSCAQLHNLKVEVLEVRSRKALGNLSTVHDRNLKLAASLSKLHKIETAIDRYLVQMPECNYPTWFENEVGRCPTKVELDEFSERYLRYISKDLDFRL